MYAIQPKLTQTTSPHTKQRIYVDEQGRKYPAVSRIAGMFWNTYGLYKWRQDVGDEEANALMKESQIRGTAIHKAIETDGWTGNEEYDQYVKVYQNCIRDDLEIIHQEIQLAYSDDKGYRMAGMSDLVAKWRGKLVIGDWKSSEELKDSKYMGRHSLQLAAYSSAYWEPTDEGVIFNLTPNAARVFTIPLGFPKMMFLDEILPAFYEYYRLPVEDRPYPNQFKKLGSRLKGFEKKLAEEIRVEDLG